jgi:hypothetical protein
MNKFFAITSIWFVLSATALAQQQPTEQDILSATIGNLFKENARLMVEIQRLQMERNNAQQKLGPSPTDGRGVPQPSVREESGRPDGGR